MSNSIPESPQTALAVSLDGEGAMKIDSQKILSNARQASTDDLLDRVTVYRQAMEAEALAIFEEELRSRGVSREAIATHGRELEKLYLRSADGAVLECSFCRCPAVVERWGWHRLWGVLPIFPRRFRSCQNHIEQQPRRRK